MGFLFRRGGSGDPAGRVIAAHGAGRCLAAVEALPRLARTPDRIPAAWERMELPLLRDLADCPPDAKAALVRALEDCSAACRNRDVARRIMALRDSLVV